jgi:PqqA peptide cyclase
MRQPMNGITAPLGLLAEVTHRCPLQCPYCSNPLELQRAGSELDTGTWKRVLSEAAALGVLQIHFSGGEPTVRKDLPELLRHARECGLYSNLITAGVLLDAARWDALVDAGLDHVQISIQDTDPANADRIAGLPGAFDRKIAFAAHVRRRDVPLTVNAVVHRQNLERLGAMIGLAAQLGARRIEVAHVQYYGWALKNRAALMPTRAQLDAATALVERERERRKGVLVIDYVVPDYYADRPKSCLGGWARRFLSVTPAGKILPCHAADSIAELDFPSVRDTSLAQAWTHSHAFNRFRGTAWMPEPCQSCEFREIDWGGCRCQAYALTGDVAATDPACSLAPARHTLIPAIAAAAEPAPAFAYRRISGG